MYVRWAEKHGYKVELQSESPGEEAGIKSTTVTVKGHNAYGWLKSESGVHRLVRISPYDSAAIKVNSCSAANCPPSGTTTASRGTALLGNSTIQAAEKLKTDLQDRSMADLVGKEYFGRYVVNWTTRHDVDGEVVSHFSYGFAAHLAILDADGKLQRVHAAHDAGTVINPALFEGQVHGGVVMGMGYALSENFPLKDGRLTSSRMSKLGLPKANHVPEIRVISVHAPDPVAPFGAKGVGEIGTIPTAPAIAEAVFHATGYRCKDLPITPEKVLKGLGKL